MAKHGRLLRNVSRIHVTRVQDYGGEESEKEEAERERSRIGPEDVSKEEDSESGEEEVTCGGNGDEEGQGYACEKQTGE